MAIINSSRKFVFIHVPKAAGTSVTNALSKYTTYKDLEIGGTHFGERIQSAYKDRFGLSKHSSASAVRDIMGQNEWDNMYKFSIVRNPYDRVISTYKFLLKWEGTPEPVKLKLASFKDLSEYVLSDMWEESDGPDSIFRPQVFWLTDIKDRSKLIVDFFGKLESLDQDLAYIKSKIEGVDIMEEKTPKLNVTEGSLNLNEKAIDKINRFYVRDFSILGYDMK